MIEQSILSKQSMLSVTHFCVCTCVCVWAQSPRRVRLFVTPRIVAYQAPLCPWDFPGKNTGVGCHFLLQGFFPTQGSTLFS